MIGSSRSNSPVLLQPSDAPPHEVPLPVQCPVVGDRDPVVARVATHRVTPFGDDGATQIISIIFPVHWHVAEEAPYQQRLDLRDIARLARDQIKQ